MSSNKLPVVLLVVVVGALFAVGAVAATDSGQVDRTDEPSTVQSGNLTFDDQATASSTFTSGSPSTPGVIVGEVDADVDSAVVVTYPESSLQAGDQVTVDLDNVGAQAWAVNGASGDADSVEDVVADGGNNPTLRLVEGVEYTFEGLPGSSHPLEFFDATGNALLSQSGEGSYENDPAVDWTDSGNSVSFTVTSALAAELDGYKCTIHSNYMVGGTTSEAATDQVIAGLNTFNASELDGGSVTVPVEEFGGFPGTHTAHLIPVANLSGNYTPGDVVSTETADAIVDNEAATVFQGELTLENQTVDGPIQEGEVIAEVATANLFDGAGNDTRFAVDLHPKNDQGELLPGEFVGASNVLNGTNTGVEITAEQFPEDGQFNEFPVTGVTELVAMVHLVDDGASPGDPASPGQYPVLAHASPDGLLFGGVTDDGTVTAETPNASVSFGDQFVEGELVDVAAVQSDSPESAVVVTYPEGGDLVIAGLTVGTFDNETVQVALEDTGGLPGNHTAHIVPTDRLSGDYAPGDTVSAPTAANISDQETASVGVDPDGDNLTATDTTGDGNLNDVDGDGAFDIFDVQALFDELASNEVQQNPGLFNFNDDDNPDEVSIFDVQGLFTDLEASPT